MSILTINSDGTVTESFSDDHTGDRYMGDWSPAANDTVQDTE